MKLLGFLIGILIVLILALGLPLIAFFTTPTPMDSFAGVFSGDGWARAFEYLGSSPNWDRIYIIVLLAVTGLFWLTCFIANFAKNHPGKALSSFLGLGLFLLCAYVYMAWPNHEELQLWQRILIYIQLGCTPLSLFFTALAGFKE